MKVYLAKQSLYFEAPILDYELGRARKAVQAVGKGIKEVLEIRGHVGKLDTIQAPG